MAEVLRSAKAVVMVTHDMSWITAFCTRAILLDKGRIVADGDPLEVAEMHEKDEERRKENKRKVRRMMSQGLIPAGGVARKARALAEAEDKAAEAKAAEAEAEDKAAAAKTAEAEGSAAGEPSATETGGSTQVEKNGRPGKSADAEQPDSTGDPEPVAAAAGRAGSKEEPPPSP
jgi:ABC-type multidrug transport system ATPase subunit